MKHAVRIHHPRPTTHLPTHEIAARRRRAVASLPLARKVTRPIHPPAPQGRKTVDTRWPNL